MSDSERLTEGRVIPGDHVISTIMQVARWGLDRVADPRARHDICLHLRSVFQRMADDAREESKRSALDWRRQPARKMTPPTGVLAAVTAELEAGRADTVKTNVTELLAAADKETKS